PGRAYLLPILDVFRADRGRGADGGRVALLRAAQRREHDAPVSRRASHTAHASPRGMSAEGHLSEPGRPGPRAGHHGLAVGSRPPTSFRGGAGARRHGVRAAGHTDRALPAVSPLRAAGPGSPAPLAGKVALVAGATRGAGRGIAVQLGAAGATV